MIGNRDRLGVIAARIIGVGRDISQSLEIRELDRRGLNERLKVIAAPSVDADGDNVLDLRYGEADRCYRHKYDQRKKGENLISEDKGGDAINRSVPVGRNRLIG
jgi:hypothetical protein